LTINTLYSIINSDIKILNIWLFYLEDTYKGVSMSIFDAIKKSKIKNRWEDYYTKEEWNFEIPDISIYEHVLNNSVEYLNVDAYNYFGNTVKYKDFLKQIDLCAKAFKVQGIKQGDVVTICMPNTPEGVICFYALNKIGAVCNMIHPLSGEQEIKEYLNSTNSVMLVMIDLCYEKIKNIIKETNVYKTIVVSVKDSMPFLLSLGYVITQGIKIEKPKKSSEYIYYKDFILKGYKYNEECLVHRNKDDIAVILHSGGTTGSPKRIVLTNGNFNALAIQAKISLKKVEVGDKCLTILPIFHGFGLGVLVHCPLSLGVTCILVPQFDAKKFDKLLKKSNPNILLGVPTLYEALINTNNTDLDLSRLKYVISGGDNLSASLERRINVFLAECGCNEKINQGYGMTECLAAVVLSHGKGTKEGSIGIPFAGNYIKIVKPGTREEVDTLEDGEICISGPTVMVGYLDNEKETNEALQIHKDGRIWLHTGDIGCINEDGIVYYKQRLKRMIISSGYNVYPSYVESVIEEHEAVLKCTVIGIPHKYKVEVPKAYIVLKNGYTSSVSTKASIKKYCEKNLARYSIPYEFEFRNSLPKTLIGKIDVKKLQEEINSTEE